jgi:hypothetical protein
MSHLASSRKLRNVRRNPPRLICSRCCARNQLLRLEPVANDVGTLLANRWPARTSPQPHTNGEQEQTKELIEFGCVRSRV